MKTEMKVLLFIKKTEQGDDGRCPLMGKITVKGRSDSIAQFSSKIRVKPGLWNATPQRCMGKSSEAVGTNREIESLLLLLRSRFNELQETGETNGIISASQIKNALQGIASAQATILGVFRQRNDEFLLRVGVNRTESTYQGLRSSYRLLAEFIRFKYKVADIPVKSLDFAFIESFASYLLVQKKFKPSTTHNHAVTLKGIARVAIQRGFLSVNPFTDFTMKVPESERRYLTETELCRLMNTTFDSGNHNFTRDMFLFSAFTGICYCDMCNLSGFNLKEDEDGGLWIDTTRQKTGTQEKLPLLDIAIRLIERYKGTAPDGKLFPMCSISSMNRQLKKIAKECAIEKSISFHMARHSFATSVCLSGGIPLETVSKALGHRDISTTQRYAKVTHEKIDRDVTNLHVNITGKYALQDIDTPSLRKSGRERRGENICRRAFGNKQHLSTGEL